MNDLERLEKDLLYNAEQLRIRRVEHMEEMILKFLKELNGEDLDVLGKKVNLKERLESMTNIRFCLLEMLLDIEKHMKYAEWGRYYGDIDYLESSYFELGQMIDDLRVVKYEEKE